MQVGGPAPRARSLVVERGEVADDVVVVEAGTVALGRPGGLRDDVDADDRLHAEALQLLADEAVAGADVERGQRAGSSRPSSCSGSRPMTTSGERHFRWSWKIRS